MRNPQLEFSTQIDDFVKLRKFLNNSAGPLRIIRMQCAETSAGGTRIVFTVGICAQNSNIQNIFGPEPK